MSSLEVEADVAEANIQKVSVGQRCEIILDAYPDSPYPGFVKKIVPTADRSRATVLTKVAFEQKDSRVLPEMSARVNFFVNEDSARVMPTGEVLGIPGDAVTNRDGRKVVFRIDGEYVDEVEVTLGRKLGKVTEVLSGLSRENEDRSESRNLPIANRDANA
jgi:multidrug efflux pump subunit AcrA (membrane-fusion protein)